MAFFRRVQVSMEGYIPTSILAAATHT